MRQAIFMLALLAPALWAAEAPRHVSRVIEPGGLPLRVHVFEDYETEIEKRWWLRGAPETNNLPPSLSASVPNRRACRATVTKDFDDKMGDAAKTFKAVVFNPVPGPPMGKNTRLSFRYRLDGTDTLRVQIYSLSNGYHRFLTLTNLIQRAWQAAAVDMTQARRPDGSGGPLSEDERIDDMQFYIAPEAELLIDDIVLYDAAPLGETRPFPRRVIFTGWFDTGKQGAGQEWPGDFEIVNHEPPLTWKAARSVTNRTTGQPWIRVHTRGVRSLSEATSLRFRYRLAGNGPLHVVLKDTTSGREWRNSLVDLIADRWAEATVDFKPGADGPVADEIRFLAQPGAQLLIDDVLLFEPVIATATATATESFPVSIRVDASNTKGELKPIWRFFGADEPNYAYMTHGKKLLAELGELRPKEVYFRTHNLLTSGDGTPALKWGSTGVYSEDADGHPIYNWTILDRIFDTYLERGVRPYVQIGFMPKDLSIKPEPYQHKWTPQARYDEIYTGWAYPPKDYNKWAELVFQWTKHCLDKYGRGEVESWYWEVWNEANIGYWRGTPEEFRKLHDYAIDAVRRALPTAKVGGPDTAGSGGRFTREFLEHCLRGTNYATGQIGTPLDFISFHAKGAPIYTNGHVRMGIANQLRTIEDGFRIVASYPELKNKPIVIGESDPEGCAACQGPQLAYRNGTMYSSYTAASFARKHDLAERSGVNLQGALTWAFEFEDQPYFAGFRSLASNGIDKPVLNVFRMFARMTGRRLAAESDGAIPLDDIVRKGVRDKPDVAALASLDEKKLCVMVWHYHDDDVSGPEAAVELTIEGLPLANGEAKLEHFRIDDEHSNAFAVWQRMGSPQQPTLERYAQLEAAGQLARLGATDKIRVENARATIRMRLSRQAVSLLQLQIR